MNRYSKTLNGHVYRLGERHSCGVSDCSANNSQRDEVRQLVDDWASRFKDTAFGGATYANLIDRITTFVQQREQAATLAGREACAEVAQKIAQDAGAQRQVTRKIPTRLIAMQDTAKAIAVLIRARSNQ